MIASTLERVAVSASRPELAGDGRYGVRLAETRREVESALRLRFGVFKVELGGVGRAGAGGLEFDEYDARCRHLIVVERATGRTVGTYRLNSIETAGGVDGFYSYSEFTIDELPAEVLRDGIEIGRACIAPEHRSTRVLFLLWKGLANFLTASGKRYFFGCCSMFTRDAAVGEGAFRQLVDGGHFHPAWRVEPRRNALYCGDAGAGDARSVELPGLFEMYLRIGAKVCGPPMLDADFGTVDFFVVFDLQAIGPRYKKMFFS
jgi:putative hemolysin